MLKKILGQAPFDITLNKKVVITPGKKTAVWLDFSNDSEYDLPLSLKLGLDVSVDVDKTEFDIVIPAGGKTECFLTFSKNLNTRMFTGKGIGELEIVDRIFDSKTLYEFEILCESAYKCACLNDGFSPSDDIIFSNGGRFFANKGETLFLEIPLMEDQEYKLCVISGKIKNINDGDVLKLTSGINRLVFEILEDGSFEFEDLVSAEKIYADTINTKFFI